MSRQQKIIFILILLLAAGLLFFRLTRHDMLGDDATYAFRSIEYFDYMASERQTTPVQWFGFRPGWSLWSFHDHPPLYFFIQNLFFKVFDVSLLVARLPSVLAALGAVIIAYFLGRELHGSKLGLLATFLLAVNNYFVWTGRVGLLESLTVFFLLLGIWFFIKGLERERNFLLSGLFFGLSFLSKYTLLLTFPGILGYLLWWERRIFKSKSFWLGVLIVFLVTLPVWIYNLNLQLTRGHLDVQFDRLLSQEHSDWPILQGAKVGTIFSPIAVVSAFGDGFSWPYFAGFVLGLAAGLYLLWRKQIDRRWYLIVLVVFSFGVFSALTNPAARLLGVIAPLVALTLAVGLMNLISRPRLFWASLIILSVYTVFYTINTNHLLTPRVGQASYSDLRLENLGFNQLDQKMQEILRGAVSTSATQYIVAQWWYRNIEPAEIRFDSDQPDEDSRFNPLIIYDSNMEWFPTLWTFERYKLYNKLLVMSSAQFWKAVNFAEVTILDNIDLTDIYLVQAAPQVAARSRETYEETDLILINFEKDNIKPEVVFDATGREAFYIYHRKIR